MKPSKRSKAMEAALDAVSKYLQPVHSAGALLSLVLRLRASRSHASLRSARRLCPDSHTRATAPATC